MRPCLSRSDLNQLLREADTCASRLRRCLALPHHERADLAQDLLVDLLRRLPAYDSTRGTFGAFVGTVLRNHSRRIAARAMTARRCSGGTVISLDAVRADGSCLGDTLSEEDGLTAWLGQPGHGVASETRMAVGDALSRLEDRDCALCLALAHASVDEVATRGLSSRATIYRRLAELRLQLSAFGLLAA